jgi:hypothetical protein
MVKSTKTVYFYICKGREMIESKDIRRSELATEEVAVQKSFENNICSSGANELTPRRDKSRAEDDRWWAAKGCAPRCWSES